MSETCAVCRKGKGPEKCEVCEFSDNGFINRQFPIPEDAKNWIETVVKPYRLQWEAKLRETELLAQLEKAKQRETELLAQLEASKSNAVLHSPPVSNTFIDPRDGRVYKTVKIGEQVWMAENLAFVAEGSKCYDNDPKNAEKYGRLYNWDTAMKACPKGWHLPSNEEWQTLVNFVGGWEISGKKLKAKSGWNDFKGKSGNGTDDFGFSALPGGYGSSSGNFVHIGYYGRWWSATENDVSGAYYRYMIYNGEDVYRDDDDKSYLRSVRCLQGRV